MDIRTFRDQCLRTPELATLWHALVKVALDAYTAGLPLALCTLHREEMPQGDVGTYDTLKRKFNDVVAALTRACTQRGIDTPHALLVEEICALYY